jgi:hypothetical protein
MARGDGVHAVAALSCAVMPKPIRALIPGWHDMGIAIGRDHDGAAGGRRNDDRFLCRTATGGKQERGERKQ